MTPVDHSEITACLLRYTRGIDRLDAELVSSAFHPGAELDGYGRPGTMTIEAFVEYALPRLSEGYRSTQHRLSNVTISPEASAGSGVTSESYVLAFHVRDNPDNPDGPDQLLSFNGRYIDRFEERTGQWRISTRSLRVDWTRIESIEQAMPGDYVVGSRDRADVSYL